VANRTIAQFVKEYRAEIEAWLKSGEHRFEREIFMGETVGRVVGRGKGGAPTGASVETSRAWVSIVRDNSAQGWHVNTSFPIMPTGRFEY
jgi:hypothetical protein